MEIQSVLQKAVEIAEGGGAIAHSYFRKALLLEVKENGTPVTVADKKTEEWMRSQIEHFFPDHGIIGEEFGEKNPQSPFQWVIDPIDGTKSFIRGIPLYGTLLALLYQKQPIVGVMVLPALAETYAAGKGLGTTCNGLPVRVSPGAELSQAILSVGDYATFESTSRLDAWKKLQSQKVFCRTYTDCFGHALVLRGAVDAMLDPAVSVWDVAALGILVEEAGGSYYTFAGEKTVYGPSFISSTSALREPLLALV